MKVWINVDRRMAILAGKNEVGWKAVEIDMAKLSAEERSYLTGCRTANFMKDENSRYIIAGDYHNCPAIEGATVGEAAEETVLGAIREKIAALAEEKKKEEEAKKKQAEKLEEKIAELLKSDPASLLSEWYKDWENRYECTKGTGKDWVTLYTVKRDYADPRLEAIYKAAEAIAEQKNIEIIAETKQKIEEYKQKEASEAIAEQKKAEARKAQIDTWVQEKGTENQKKRHEINLLSEAEVIDSIRDEAYRALDCFPRYEKMTASDVCTCEDHYDQETGHPDSCDVEFSVRPASEATAEEYEAMAKIEAVAKQAHPGACVTLLDHVGSSEDCENEVVRKSAKVEIAVGAFNFSREYAI